MDDLKETIHKYLAQTYPTSGQLLAKTPELAAFYQSAKRPIPKKTQPPKQTAQNRPSPPPEKKPPPPIANAKKSKVEERRSPPPKEKPTGAFSSSLSKLYEKIAPSIPIRKAPPADTEAKRVKESWKEIERLASVPIFVTSALKEYQVFLTNLSKAIDTRLAPSHCVNIAKMEKENGWEVYLNDPNIRLTIIEKQLLFSSANLLVHYKEERSGATIGRSPVLVLENLGQYLKDPTKKKALWEELVKRLES